MILQIKYGLKKENSGEIPKTIIIMSDKNKFSSKVNKPLLSL